jgi:hypothetical protein
VKRALLALVAFLLSCGGGGSDAFDAQDILARHPELSISWAIDGDHAHCSNKSYDVTPDVFPSGWYCHFRCGYHNGRFQQVWVALNLDASGEWIDPPDVYTGKCYDADVTCPTCNLE